MLGETGSCLRVETVPIRDGQQILPGEEHFAVIDLESVKKNFGDGVGKGQVLQADETPVHVRNERPGRIQSLVPKLAIRRIRVFRRPIVEIPEIVVDRSRSEDAVVGRLCTIPLFPALDRVDEHLQFPAHQ